MTTNKAKKDQEEYYNKTAQGYDNVDGFSRDNRNHMIKLEYLISRMGLTGKERVLEIGIGTGIHAVHLLKKFPKLDYVGIDISPEMVNICEEKLSQYSKIKLVAGDYTKEELGGKFDAIFMAATLHHLPQPPKEVVNMYGLLKEGGKLVMVEPNYFFPKNYYQMITIPEEVNQSYIREPIIRASYEAAGFKDIEYEYMLYTPPIPRFMIPFYRVFDSLVSKIPILRKMSIVIGASGTK